MSGFRVIVSVSQANCVIAYSEVTDYVSASQTARYLRFRGYRAEPVPNTRPLDKQAKEWDRCSPAGMVKILTCTCNSPTCGGVAVHIPENLQEACNGK